MFVVYLKPSREGFWRGVPVDLFPLRATTYNEAIVEIKEFLRKSQRGYPSRIYEGVWFMDVVASENLPLDTWYGEFTKEGSND